MSKILIADDEKSIVTILEDILKNQGHEALVASNGADALEFLKTDDQIELAILDIRMPKKTGLEVLEEKRNLGLKKIPVLIMTAQDTMDHAIDAMKLGAFDYIPKPFRIDQITQAVDKALKSFQANQNNVTQSLPDSPVSKKPIKIIGQTSKIREIYKTIGKVANQNVPVLIMGESGTGKELIAKALHYESDRNHQPFVAINCAAIPSELLESELFGVKRGAFTSADRDKKGSFLQANKGTLFLDEIGDLPLKLQAKILRVLQEKEVTPVGDQNAISIDVRIISATNNDLVREVEKGRFRSDLFFRLNVVPIFVPPLRERKKDIPLLIDYFLQKNRKEGLSQVQKLTEKALHYLQNLDWPGNIRELENLIKRVSVLTSTEVLQKTDFEKITFGKDLNPMSFFSGAGAISDAFALWVENYFEKYAVNNDLTTQNDLLAHYRTMVEKPLITQVLKSLDGNQLKAAQVLGINRNTLHKKMREYQINAQSFKKNK